MLKIARIAATVAAATLAFAAHAQTPAWPTRAVTIIVPFTPGGGTDIGTRLVAQRLAQLWGQPVVVDNRPGAAGNVGLELTARAKPDGYTLVAGNVGTQSINPFLYKKLNYNPDGFVPVTMMAELPFALVVTPSLPARTPKELVALAKAKPGKLTFASSGTGGSPHLSGEIFKLATGTDMLHVPYKGGGAAMTDLMAGNVDMLFASILETAGHVKAGKLRALAVTTARRSVALPDVPTLDEAGLKGFDMGTWFGVLAPAATPREVLARLGADMNRIIESPQFRRKMEEIGAEPIGGSPEQMARQIRDDTDRFARLVKDAKVALD